MSELWEVDAARDKREAGDMYYKGIGPEEGMIIEQRQAYAYALERCLGGTTEEQKEFQEMLEEWYYSGNWIKQE